MSSPAAQALQVSLLQASKPLVKDGVSLEKAHEALLALGFSAAPVLEAQTLPEPGKVSWNMAVWCHPAGVVVGALVSNHELRDIRAVVMSDEGWKPKKTVLPGSMYSTTEKRLDGSRSFTHAFRAESRHSIQSFLTSLVDNDYALHGFEYWHDLISGQQGRGWHFVFDHLRVKEALDHPKAAEWLAALPFGVQSHLVNRPSQLVGGRGAWHLYVEELVSQEGQASLLDAPTPAHTAEVESWVRQALGEDAWDPAWHALPDMGLRLPHLMVAVMARSEGVSARLQRWLKEAPQEAVEALVEPLPSGPTWVDLLTKHVLREPAVSFGEHLLQPPASAPPRQETPNAWVLTTALLHAFVDRLPAPQREAVESQLLNDLVSVTKGIPGESLDQEVIDGLVQWVRHLQQEGLLETVLEVSHRPQAQSLLRKLSKNQPQAEWGELGALFRESWLKESFEQVVASRQPGTSRPHRPRF